MPKKNSGTINYPGSKTTIAPWIIEHMPEHECYVEPFGGSAAVLFNKPRSTIEVYNDVYGRVVNFFEVCRDRGEELYEWLESTPYSREMYERYVEDMRSENEPSDPVTKAGRFFYIQSTSFSGKIDGGGFRINSTAKCPADEITYKYERTKGQVKRIQNRFEEVIIENLDYSELTEKYDREGTLFYYDPPYYRVGDSYYEHEGDFDHERFYKVLCEIDGSFIVSYEELPPAFEDEVQNGKWDVSVRSRNYTTQSDSSKKSVERLVMNYDSSDASFNTPGEDVLNF